MKRRKKFFLAEKFGVWRNYKHTVEQTQAVKMVRNWNYLPSSLLLAATKIQKKNCETHSKLNEEKFMRRILSYFRVFPNYVIFIPHSSFLFSCWWWNRENLKNEWMKKWTRFTTFFFDDGWKILGGIFDGKKYWISDEPSLFSQQPKYEANERKCV